MQIKSGTLDWLQQNVIDCFGAIIPKLIGESYSPNTMYVLDGLVNSGSGSNYIFSAGWVCLGGIIYPVPAATFTTTGGQVPILTQSLVYTSDAQHDPVPFTDGVSRNVHSEYKMIISAGTAGSGTKDWSSVIYVNPLVAQTLTVTHVKWSTYSWLKYQKDVSGFVSLQGSLSCITGGATNDQIAQLPANYRPTSTLLFPATKRNNSGGLYEPCVLSIDTSGYVSVYGVNTALANLDNVFFGSISFFCR